MLLSHFQTCGTPIMIGASVLHCALLLIIIINFYCDQQNLILGGGVLAHTILGVDYNGSTGEIQ